MAKFRISARPATFYDCGTHKMVSVALMSVPIKSQIVDCANVSDLKTAIASMADEVKRDHPGVGFSTHQRLLEGRAPSGYRKTYFGLDYDAAD